MNHVTVSSEGNSECIDQVVTEKAGNDIYRMESNCSLVVANDVSSSSQNRSIELNSFPASAVTNTAVKEDEGASSASTQALHAISISIQSTASIKSTKRKHKV